MAEIGFYHLTRTSADAALPALLARTLASGQRAVIRCGSAERMAAIDRSLWEDKEWLPHGTDHPTLQPILLTLDNARPNGGQFLFLLDGITAPLADYIRVFDLFDGTDPDAVSAARLRWTGARSAGHTLAYWQQGPTGWKKNA